MNDLIIKNVNVLGDSILAAKDSKGNIWVGINAFCRGLDMNKKQRDWQVKRVQDDKTLSKGCREFSAGIFDPSNSVYALRLDFVPLWLAKISITNNMEDEHPELAKKLLNYQLKAKDILANAFIEKKQSENPATLQQQIQLIAQGTTELYQKVDTLAERMDKFEQDLPLLPVNADELSHTVKKRVVEVLGGKDSNAYHNKSISQTAFSDAYRNLKYNFGVNSYKNIKRCQMDIALRIAREYQPPVFLEERIRHCNSQMTLDI